MEASPSAAMMGLAMPLLDGLLIHPDGQRPRCTKAWLYCFQLLILCLDLPIWRSRW